MAFFNSLGRVNIIEKVARRVITYVFTRVCSQARFNIVHLVEISFDKSLIVFHFLANGLAKLTKAQFGVVLAEVPCEFLNVLTVRDDPLFVHAVCVAQVGAASLEAYLLELFAYFVEDHVELGARLVESHKGV